MSEQEVRRYIAEHRICVTEDFDLAGRPHVTVTKRHVSGKTSGHGPTLVEAVEHLKDCARATIRDLAALEGYRYSTLRHVESTEGSDE